ncbi:MAG: hypothetical protein FWF94_04280 [Oscillospiraceae bacterium]|nr:hypothetical protein [Oscillospiraceae bacterium]
MKNKDFKPFKRYNGGSRGKSHAIINFFVIAAVIIGLCAYFTVKSLWNAGTIAVIVILLFPAALYFWLWRTYF